MNTLNTSKLIAVLVFAILLLLFAPLAVIWALNTLFALAIPYTFWTWLAMLVLTGTFGKANVNTNKQ